MPWKYWSVLVWAAVDSATGSDRTSWLVPVKLAPPLCDTDRTIALWQAPGVLTPVYRFCNVAGVAPAGTQPGAPVGVRVGWGRWVAARGAGGRGGGHDAG